MSEKVHDKLYADMPKTVRPWVEDLLNNDYKVYKFFNLAYPSCKKHFVSQVMIYSGQLDVIVAYPLTEKYIDALEWKGAEEYKTATRKVWRVDGDVAGYAREVRVNPNQSNVNCK